MPLFTVDKAHQALIDAAYKALNEAHCERIRRAIEAQVLRDGRAFDESPSIFHSLRTLKPYAELAMWHVTELAIQHRCSSMAKKQADMLQTFDLAGFPLDLDDEDGA